MLGWTRGCGKPDYVGERETMPILHCNQENRQTKRSLLMCFFSFCLGRSLGSLQACIHQPVKLLLESKNITIQSKKRLYSKTSLKRKKNSGLSEFLFWRKRKVSSSLKSIKSYQNLRHELLKIGQMLTKFVGNQPISAKCHLQLMKFRNLSDIWSILMEDWSILEFLN